MTRITTSTPQLFLRKEKFFIPFMGLLCLFLAVPISAATSASMIRNRQRNGALVIERYTVSQ